MQKLCAILNRHYYHKNDPLTNSLNCPNLNSSPYVYHYSIKYIFHIQPHTNRMLIILCGIILVCDVYWVSYYFDAMITIAMVVKIFLTRLHGFCLKQIMDPVNTSNIVTRFGVIIARYNNFVFLMMPVASFLVFRTERLNTAPYYWGSLSCWSHKFVGTK